MEKEGFTFTYTDVNGQEYEKELTEKQEQYCQLRSQGYTMTRAAEISYETNHPAKIGSALEKEEHIKLRIQMLKDEMAEVSGITAEEQLRRYNSLYLKAVEKGNLTVAKQMLERIDALCGFEAPKRSETTTIRKKGEGLKGEDLQKDIERFAGVLTPPTPQTETEH